MTFLPRTEFCDAPKPWGLYSQDTANPQMETLVELHDNVMFYLVIVLFGIAWITLSLTLSMTIDYFYRRS